MQATGTTTLRYVIYQTTSFWIDSAAPKITTIILQPLIQENIIISCSRHAHNYRRIKFHFTLIMYILWNVLAYSYFPKYQTQNMKGTNEALYSMRWGIIHKRWNRPQADTCAHWRRLWGGGGQHKHNIIYLFTDSTHIHCTLPPPSQRPHPLYTRLYTQPHPPTHHKMRHCTTQSMTQLLTWSTMILCSAFKMKAIHLLDKGTWIHKIKNCVG